MAISGTGHDHVPAHLACGPVGGMNARDQRVGHWQQGTKDCRLSARSGQKIRVKSQVGITGGYVSEAPSTKKKGGPRPGGKNRRKK